MTTISFIENHIHHHDIFWGGVDAMSRHTRAGHHRRFGKATPAAGTVRNSTGDAGSCIQNDIDGQLFGLRFGRVAAPGGSPGDRIAGL